jgi:hypothetical protein
MIKRIIVYGLAASAVIWILFLPPAPNVTITGKILSPQEQKIWIDQILMHQTKDGATVRDVLAQAQVQRPEKFKVSSMVVANRDSTYSIVILYWIGKEREKYKDLTDLGFAKTAGWFGNHLTPFETPVSQALERGRDSFLTAVDDIYRQRCVDLTTHEQRC